MNPQTNIDFCVIDHSSPFKTEELWKIVEYGRVHPIDELGDFFQESATVASAAKLFKVSDVSLRGNVTFVTSGTTSDVNVEMPEIPWFINDKSHGIIVFSQRALLAQDVTWASCIEAELPKWSVETRFNQAFQRIGKLATFPENWDSYAAKAIDAECISQGVIIFKELLKLRSFAEVEIPAPFVAPLSSGGIQIEWEEGERYLEVSITPDPLTVDYFATDKAKEGQLTLEGSLRAASALKELLTWFVTGATEDLAQLTFEEPSEE